VRRGGWGNSTPFQKKLFLGMGTNPNGCFLGGMGGRRLVVSQGRKVGGILFCQVLLHLFVVKFILVSFFFLFFHNERS